MQGMINPERFSPLQHPPYKEAAKEEIYGCKIMLCPCLNRAHSILSTTTTPPRKKRDQDHQQAGQRERMAAGS
jgi:hypothetical protein